MNEKIIWDFLYGKLNNEYGVAGIMGNLYALSDENTYPTFFMAIIENTVSLEINFG